MDEIFSIYCITNLLDQKKYVGVTKQEPASKRWSQHKSPKGPHQQKKPLHRAIMKHGEDNFKFEIVCQTKDVKSAIELEISFIEKYNTLLNEGWGYNLTKGGDGIWGYKFSDLQKEKLSEIHLRRWTPEMREQYSKRQKGKKATEQSKEKCSKTMKDKFSKNKHWTKNTKRKKEWNIKTATTMKNNNTKPNALAHQKSIEKCSKYWLLTSPEGQQYNIKNLRAFCREHKLSAENLWKVSKGTISHSQGWKCHSSA